jgi:hypothetical protein
MGARSTQRQEFSMCKICDGHKWLSVETKPIAPYRDQFGVGLEDLPCPVCNDDGYYGPSGSSNEFSPYWSAEAVGGLNGPYTILSRLSPNGDVQTYIAERQVLDFWHWMRQEKVLDCPVCYGKGRWIHNYRIEECLACHGSPEDAVRFQFPLSWGLSTTLKSGPTINLTFVN